MSSRTTGEIAGSGHIHQDDLAVLAGGEAEHFLIPHRHAVTGFGGDAETAAITHAIARFNKKYPNVHVDLQMDVISTGWGDYVTKVLGQFTAGRFQN